jgi:hypothetical protein
MYIPIIPSGHVAAAVAATAALALTAPSPAHARNAVFGGSTDAREPIVLTTDARKTKLKSAVIAWVAKCDGGKGFRAAVQLTPVVTTAGFPPGERDLQMSRNGKRRFAGTQHAGYDLGGDQMASVTVRLAGGFRAAKASGTLSAEVSIFDAASQARTEGCRTGTVRWSATRSPGKIYGGKTSQEEPLVVRVDAGHNMVSDVMTGWQTPDCTPADNFFTLSEDFRSFPLTAGRFAHDWGEQYLRDDGGTVRFAYALAGEVAARSAHGSLQVTVTGTDAAGATDLTCDTGPVTWTAVG